jgi:hypothetical protein
VAEQLDLIPDCEKNDRVERCARNLLKWQRERMEALAKEKDYRAKLEMILEEEGFAKKGYRRGNIACFVDKSSKAKVREVGSEDGE